MLIIGIDDSGRGPVMGPMVMAGCLLDAKTEKEFKEIGIRDSKTLSPRKREKFALIIKEKALDYEIVVIHPNEIDARNGAGLNLNNIEAIKSAEIINKLNKGKDKIKVIIDCPSNNIKKWADYLKNYVSNKENLEIIAEHKADVNHVSVSAASVLAKTTRDAEIEKIKKKVGKDFGSGYPNDPLTIKFLEKYGKKHRKDGILRETWGTWKNLQNKKSQKNLEDFKNP